MPAKFAKRGGFLGRADDVGEKHRGKHAVDRDGRKRAGQKLLDRIGDVVGIVADEGDMVDPWELEIAGAWNMRGENQPPSTLTFLSSVRWRTRVGTRIVETMSLMSIRRFMRAKAAAPAGLLDTRSFLPHQRLTVLGVQGMTVTEINGFCRQKGHTEIIAAPVRRELCAEGQD